MAYVAISKELQSDVEAKIRNMHHAEKAQIPEPAQELVIQHDDPMALEFIWGNHLHLKDAIPDEWCTMTETIRLKSEAKAIAGRSASVEFILRANRTKFRTPQTSVSTYSGLVIGNLPTTHPLIVDLWLYAEAVSTVHERWKKIRIDVMAFLTSAKSLNEALKLWPALSLYIPERYLNKVAEKKEKASATPSAAAAMLASIDTGGITAAAVSARMSTT